ncbi:hypothetical protein JMUB6875_77160 [Nocardia sp. JMUB6875]|uniref:hypothetical protein n=1 Tax=Nocardia sp. JMUB6875 TaxID=3158170 RepID=UPI0032E5BF83
MPTHRTDTQRPVETHCGPTTNGPEPIVLSGEAIEQQADGPHVGGEDPAVDIAHHDRTSDLAITL